MGETVVADSADADGSQKVGYGAIEFRYTGGSLGEFQADQKTDGDQQDQ